MTANANAFLLVPVCRTGAIVAPLSERSFARQEARRKLALTTEQCRRGDLRSC